MNHGTRDHQFQYADHIALTYQSKDLTEGEKVLTDDLKILNTHTSTRGD